MQKPRKRDGWVGEQSDADAHCTLFKMQLTVVSAAAVSGAGACCALGQPEAACRRFVKSIPVADREVGRVQCRVEIAASKNAFIPGG